SILNQCCRPNAPKYFFDSIDHLQTSALRIATSGMGSISELLHGVRTEYFVGLELPWRALTRPSFIKLTGAGHPSAEAAPTRLLFKPARRAFRLPGRCHSRSA